MGAFNTFLNFSSACSAADTAMATKNLVNLKRREMRDAKKQAKAEQATAVETARAAKELYASEQSAKWIETHPEDTELIGKINKLYHEMRKLTAFQMLSKNVGVEFLYRQNELREEAYIKIPHLVDVLPGLTWQFDGMKFAKLSERNGTLQSEYEEIISGKTANTVKPQVVAMDVPKQDVVTEGEPLDFKTLSASELKSQIKLQKQKISNLKEFYRNQIQSLENRRSMLRMKTSFTFGSPKSSNQLESVLNELSITKEEKFKQISQAESILTELQNELRSR